MCIISVLIVGLWLRVHLSPYAFVFPHIWANKWGERESRRRGRVNCQVAVRLCKCGAKAGTQRGHRAQGAGKKYASLFKINLHRSSATATWSSNSRPVSKAHRHSPSSSPPSSSTSQINTTQMKKKYIHVYFTRRAHFFFVQTVN